MINLGDLITLLGLCFAVFILGYNIGKNSNSQK